MDKRKRAPTPKMQEYMTQKRSSTTDVTPVPSNLARFSDEISQMQQQKREEEEEEEIQKDKEEKEKREGKGKERDTREERGRENKPHREDDG